VDHLHRSERNTFGVSGLNRVHQRRLDEEWLAIQRHRPDTRYLVVYGDLNLVTVDRAPCLLAPEQADRLLEMAESLVFLGTDDQQHTLFSIGLAHQTSEPPAFLTRSGGLKGLRSVAPLLGQRDASLLAYAKAMAHWHHTHRFCGTCGAPTNSAEAGHLRACSNADCGALDFPRTDPAIIVLVTYGDHCLLGRQARWPERMYSLVAGFVEPGESLEAAVAREIDEEVGLPVQDVVYRSSQPWPFPRSLMLGFNAKALSDAIHRRDEELEDAQWFTRAGMAEALRSGDLKLPSPISISYRLIEEWFDSGTAQDGARESLDDIVDAAR
jgi:NAD+ diphosphatase